MNIYDFATYDIKHVFNLMLTNENGLTTIEAAERQKKYINNIPKEKVYWYQILLLQIKSPFVFILFTAAFISLFVDNILNSIVILAIITINTLIGFYQEYNARQALLLLKKKLELTSDVIRDNSEVAVNNSSLVPGDLIILKAGSYIPADIRLIESTNFSVDESALTGETNVVIKDTVIPKKPLNPHQATNLAFCGTYVATGYAKAIVITTGIDTIFGSINILTINIIKKSSYQKNIIKLSKFIMWMAIFTIIGLFIFHLIVVPGNISFFQLAMFSVALAISVIPEALPLVSTFAMSKGAIDLAKHHVLVKRLSALEDLGNLNMLCTDKTGTLTENRLTIKKTINLQGHDISLLAYLVTMTKGLKKIDPIHQSFIDYWHQNHNKSVLLEKQILEHIPFDSIHRYNITKIKYDNKILVIASGSYEEIIKMCKKIDGPQKKKIEEWVVQQENSFLRIIAIASKETDEKYKLQLREDNLTLSGLIAMSDPIKPSSYEAVNKAKTLGVSLIMLTGDSKEIGFQVAKEIGLADTKEQVITGSEFENLTIPQKIASTSNYKVFARITPSQKFEIINILSKNYRVGFLGDGINDAPALRAANVGIAVQHSADIAQDAADIIILQKNLLVIIDGIKYGRRIFVNTIKYVKTTLTSTLGSFYSLTVGSLIIKFLPMLPLQILLVNILSDLPMISIATDFVDNKDIAHPTEYNFKDMALTCSIFAIINSAFDFVIFGLFYKENQNILQTNWFIFNTLSSLALIFSFRSKRIFYKAKLPSQTLLLFSCFSAILTIILPSTKFGEDIFYFHKPSFNNLIYIFITVTIYFITNELLKIIWYRQANSKNPNFRLKPENWGPR